MNTVSEPGPSTDRGDVIRVSTAKKRYLGGAMSLRWWYKQVETGRLPHFRAGSAVRLRVADVEAFVARQYRDRVAAEPEPGPPPAPPSPPLRRGGIRFFRA